MTLKQKYGPWALITGGSDGVGAAFASQLAEAGVNLSLVSRSAQKLDDLAGQIRSKSGVEVRTLPFDLSQPGALGAIRAVSDDVDIGLVVCNVGAVFGGTSFLESEPEDVEKTIRVNSLGHATLSHHFGRKMAARGRGGIVLIGSLAGNAGCATMVLYSAGKAFAQVFAEGLWAELKPRGVDVLYVVLGATDTPKRASLNIVDAPGQIVADPADVARDALANLANGPVFVPPHLAEGFQFFSAAPRREAAEAMSSMLRGFMPDAD
jgi:hypothetical protein